MESRAHDCRLSVHKSTSFACAPDQFPEVIGIALARGDVHQWAAKAGIAVRRG